MRSSAPFIIYKGTKITPGWPVRVLPSAPGKQDGFDCLIRQIWADPQAQKILDIEVIDPYNGAVRNFRPVRLQPYLRNVEKIQRKIAERDAKARGQLASADLTKWTHPGKGR